MGQTDGLKKYRVLKKDLARILTEKRGAKAPASRKGITMAETQQQKRHKTEKIGKVVSAKMAKTIVVEVSRRVQHRLYRRIISRKSKFYAHDEEGLAKLGDRVRIVESRPLSKLKRWRLVEVVWKAAEVNVRRKSHRVEPRADRKDRRR